MTKFETHGPVLREGDRAKRGASAEPVMDAPSQTATARATATHSLNGRDSARAGAWNLAVWLVAALAFLPIAAILLSAPAGGFDAIAHLARTVLWRYTANTALLILLTASVAGIVGTGCAWLVSAARFPGRRVFAWALVLPLAVPAYIAAYVYADLLDYAGPVQSGLRALSGTTGAILPPVRSLPGGAFVLGIVLYPYVYLLARGAFAAQSVRQLQAARSLGASPLTAFRRIALPAARPAIAGGLALVAMEVLADFGVAEYFAIPTFSTGIFRSWLAMGDKQAALKLAALMLVFVALLVLLEARSRRGRSDARDGLRKGSEPLVQLTPVGRGLAFVACALPLLLGFIVPALRLAWLAIDGASKPSAADLWEYVGGSLWLGLAAALVCLAAGLALVVARARSTSRVASGAIRLATLGYALPGALLAVGLLAPLGLFDVAISRTARDTFGYTGGLVLGGSGVILVYALSVRFLTVSYNTLDGGMSKIPPSLGAAARALGASPARVFRRITAPLLAPSCAAAGALVFIDTVRELPATLILRPFNLETLATRTYRLASDERLGEASVPALILLAAGLVPVLLLTRTPDR